MRIAGKWRIAEMDEWDQEGSGHVVERDLLVRTPLHMPKEVSNLCHKESTLLVNRTGHE